MFYRQKQDSSYCLPKGRKYPWSCIEYFLMSISDVTFDVYFIQTTQWNVAFLSLNRCRISKILLSVCSIFSGILLDSHVVWNNKPQWIFLLNISYATWCPVLATFYPLPVPFHQKRQNKVISFYKIFYSRKDIPFKISFSIISIIFVPFSNNSSIELPPLSLPMHILWKT